MPGSAGKRERIQGEKERNSPQNMKKTVRVPTLPKVKMLPVKTDPAKKLVPVQNPSNSCVLCNASLASKAELQDHFRLHANGTIDTKGRSVKSVQSTKNNTPALKPMKQISTPSSKVLVPVIIDKNDVKIKWTKCDVCEDSFESVTLAIQHKFKKHPGSSVKHYCGYCGKQFPLEPCKVAHIKSSHQNAAKTDKLYQCIDCNEKFFNVDAITFHVRSTHKRVTALVNPTATLGPSKKIKINMSGEPCSVYYCHLCGHEYLVKFNLQKHLEAYHSQEQRCAPVEELIKCRLCDAVFYNKKAYDSHNLLHKPEDLYVGSEADRRMAVLRVDQDFDHSRVPDPLDKYIPKTKQTVKQSVNVKTEASAPVAVLKDTLAANTESKGPSRNKAMVDSDSDDDKSDTSIESDEEATAQSSKRKKVTKKKKVITKKKAKTSAK